MTKREAQLIRRIDAERNGAKSPTAAAYLAATKPLDRMGVTIPGLRTVSEANSHTHWRVRQRRAKTQRETTHVHLRYGVGTPPALPAVVTLTRLSPRRLDDDNLHGALKHVRDGVADWFGVDDGDERYTWVVRQEKCRDVGVRIDIAAAAKGGPQ